MGKRLLAGVLALGLLLGGCSADRESSSSSGAMHAVVCWITNNGHLMDVQISVPQNWEVNPEEKWNLEADGKTVVEFKLHSYTSTPMDINDYDWSLMDSEYMESQDLIEAGALEISGMSGRYYRYLLRRESREVVYCSVFDGVQVVDFNYYPDSGIPLEEVERIMASIVVRKQRKEPQAQEPERLKQQLLQNAEWLTLQLGHALMYSSDPPALSGDPYAGFLQTERFVYSGIEYLEQEGYLYPEAFYTTTDADGFPTHHFPRQELERMLQEVLGIEIPGGWDTLYVPEQAEYQQYFTVEYGPGGVEISEINSTDAAEYITVSYRVQPRIEEDQSVLAGRYQNRFRICTREDGKPYLHLEAVERLEP